jgi:hypothetical protein
MNSLKLNQRLGRNIIWPNRCACCNAPSDDWAEASLTTATHLRHYLIAWGWTEKSNSISYPVCSKHKFICSCLNLPEKWGFINCSTAFIGIPPLVAIGLGEVAPN